MPRLRVNGNGVSTLANRAAESIRVGRQLARELEETGSVRITIGSGNVFRDLGLEDWDGHQPEDL